MIESFFFGQMVVDGKTYTSDLILFPGGKIHCPWWRKQGHRVTIADITDLVTAAPDVIVIGTGVYGLMNPTRNFRDFLATHRIRMVAEITKKAWQTYNKLAGKTRTGGCFHVGC